MLTELLKNQPEKGINWEPEQQHAFEAPVADLRGAKGATPLETVWGGILKACGTQNATLKRANNVFDCRKRFFWRHFDRLQR